MFDQSSWNECKNNAVSFLLHTQQEDGCFISCSSQTPDNFQNALQFRTIFSTALIAQSLSFLQESAELHIIKNKAIHFLLYEKSLSWSWNYWTKKSTERKILPFPDDLDDTFCALTAIQLCAPSKITGNALGKITQILTSLEDSIGGPYRTWLVTKDVEKVWLDVDLVVNTNVAYFLHLQNISLPRLTAMFDEAINSSNFYSPYYPYPYPVFYFLSRFIKGTKRKTKLIDQIIKAVLSVPKEPLSSALCLLALIHLQYSGKEKEELASFIFQSQRKNGSWSASCFYTGVNPDRNKMFYAGSEALTTGYCLEALHKYINTTTKRYHSVSKKSERVNIHTKIIKQVHNRFTQLSSPFSAEAVKYLENTIIKDTDKQITLLPLYIYRSLGKREPKLPNDVIVSLGSASVFGWIAYTIYDDFLDDEASIPSLPVANVCLRELTTLFERVLPSNLAFSSLFQSIMDRLEEANLWEVTHTRCKTPILLLSKDKQFTIPDYTDYKYLAYRSLGHALAPIAILVSVGYAIDSFEVKQLLRFFHNFLIARQLNDDAHDWETDLDRGQINSVGSLVLKEFVKTKSRVTLSNPKRRFQSIFWNIVVDEVNSTIEAHISEAKKTLDTLKIIQKKQFLLSLLDKQYTFVQHTRAEKKRASEFMQTYNI